MSENKKPVTRSQIELNSASFNYFIALKLSTSETNVKAIEKAITEIQGTADDDMYHVRLKMLTPDMTEVMVNDATYNNLLGQYEPGKGSRKREAEAAKRFKLDEVMLLVKNICLNNGMLHKSALQKICMEANKEAKYFQFPDLENEFIAWNSEITVQDVDETNFRLCLKEYDNLTMSLRLLRKQNLYEFLDISTTATLEEISNAEQNKFREYMSNPNNSVKMMGKDFCGYARKYLLDIELKTQYDNYIKISEKVWHKLAFKKQNGDNAITRNEFINFANLIKEALSIDVDTGEQILRAGLKEYGLGISIGGDFEPKIKYIDDITGIKIPLLEFDRITKALQCTLRENNLYEFLEISPKASPQEITQAKTNKYNEYMSKGDRSLKSFGKDMCAYVEQVLSDSEKRQQYNYYIKIQDKVWKQFALRKQYGLEYLPLNEYNTFAAIIRNSLNFDNDTVDKMLGTGLKAYGLVVASANNKTNEQITCPHCGKTFLKN